MTIADLIRKPKVRSVATAIPAISAISATQHNEAAGTVARIATVAIAIPTERQTIHVARKVGANDEIRIRAWLTYIGETHQATIDEVLTMCATDPAALAYYLMRAMEE